MNSRVAVEQAKRILAERLGLETGAAFDELRRLAARAGRRLSEVATAVAAGDFGPVTADEAGLRVLLIRRFGPASLARLRTAAGVAAARHGLSSQQVWQFVLAMHEAAANAVRHGGGSGQLLLWKQDGELIAEISDYGPGMPDGHRIIPSDPGASLQNGRGLWLINQVCAGLDIETGQTGTRLTLRYPIDSPVAGPLAG